MKAPPPAQEHVEEDPFDPAATGANERDAEESDALIFSEGLNEPGTTKNAIIEIPVLRPDLWGLEEIPEQIPGALFPILDNLDPDVPAPGRNLSPGRGQNFIGDKRAVEKDMEVKVPALPTIRRLDAVKAAQDRFESASELSEIRPELPDVAPAPFPVWDIPKGQRHKINGLPLRDDFKDRSEMIAEPFFPADRAGPIRGAGVDPDLERCPTVGADDSGYEGMRLVGHFFLKAAPDPRDRANLSGPAQPAPPLS